MIEQEKILFLQKCFLFKDLSEKDLRIIARNVREKQFSKKSIFIEQDTPAEEMFIITEGLIKIFRTTEQGKEITYEIKSPGYICGEFALIDDELRSASVMALDQVKTIILSKQTFSAILNTHPFLTKSLLKKLVHTIRGNTQYIESTVDQTLPRRTFEVLQTIEKHFSEGTITLSQDDLASMLGVTRPRITEALQQLQKQNKIILSRKKIQINS